MAHEALEVIIGRNIARYRETAGLTQATLAEKIGISTAFVSRVERGQKMMKVATLYATAQALRVSCDALLSEDSSAASLENIKQLLTGQTKEYIQGIEKLVRTCVEEFEAKEVHKNS